MSVWNLDEFAKKDRPPKAPYVEMRKCKAFRCKQTRSLSFPLVKNNPWCTTHATQVYFAAQGWENASVQAQLRRAATPPTNAIEALWRRVHPR